MGLIADLTAADKKGLFLSDDYYTMHPTGFLPLDYANGFWQEKEMKDGTRIMVPMVGLMGGTFTGIIATTGSGKAQPDSTPIPTPFGPRKLGDLEVGSFVLDKSGNPSTIKEIFPRGELEVFQVELATGQKTPASKDHLWTVKCDRFTHTETVTITTGEIMERMKANQYIYLPMNGPVYFNTKDDWSVHPWYIGSLLGGLNWYPDGDWSISSKTDEIPKKLAEEFEWEWKETGSLKNGYNVYRFTKKNKPICAFYDPKNEISFILSKGYIIPEVIMTGSILSRYQFLAGLLRIAHDEYRVDNTFGWMAPTVELAYQLTQLARSLGIFTVLKKGQKLVSFHFTKEQYDIIFGDNDAWMYCYKPDDPDLDAFYDVPPSNQWIEIVDVKDMGYKESMRCIYVNNSDHLYITDDYIVTHNTTLADQIGYNMIRPFKDGLLMHVDAEKTSNKQRILQITNCNGEEKRIILNKQHTAIEDVMEMVNQICEMKEAVGRSGMVKTASPFKEGDTFWAYPPTVFIIDSLPSFNSKNYKVEDLGTNADGMIAARDTTRFYTNCLDRAWHYNLNFIVINHIKPKVEVNPYAKAPSGLLLLGPGEHLPRGTVAQYYSQTYFRIKMYKSDPYVVSDHGFDGYRCELELSKSKTNSIGTTIPLAFNNAKGFDQIYSLFEYAKACGLLQGRNPHLYFNTMEEMKFSRKDFRKKFISEDIFRVRFMEVLRPMLEMLLAKKPTIYEVGTETPEMLDFAYGGTGLELVS